MIKGRHDLEVAFPGDVEGNPTSALRGWARPHHLCARLCDRSGLRGIDIVRDGDDRGEPGVTSRLGDRPAVVATRVGDDAEWAGGPQELLDEMRGAAGLEGPAGLLVLELQKDPQILAMRVFPRNFDEGGAEDPGRNLARRRSNL